MRRCGKRNKIKSKRSNWERTYSFWGKYSCRDFSRKNKTQRSQGNAGTEAKGCDKFFENWFKSLQTGCSGCEQ